MQSGKDRDTRKRLSCSLIYEAVIENHRCYVPKEAIIKFESEAKIVQIAISKPHPFSYSRNNSVGRAQRKTEDIKVFK